MPMENSPAKRWMWREKTPAGNLRALLTASQRSREQSFECNAHIAGQLRNLL